MTEFERKKDLWKRALYKWREFKAICYEINSSREGQKIRRGRKKRMNHDYLLQFFDYEHLPENLQIISKPFREMAHRIVEEIPMNPERTAALRKLLEAKDCAVRAVLFKSA